MNTPSEIATLSQAVKSWGDQVDALREWMDFERTVQPAKLHYHAFEQGMYAGVAGFDHRRDCAYSKPDYRMWWMHGCIEGNARREALAIISAMDAARAADAAIISRLPHTADGVPVICDGMVVYCPKGHTNKLTHATGRVYCTDGDCWSDGCQGDSGSGTYYSFDQCCASVRGEQT